MRFYIRYAVLPVALTVAACFLAAAILGIRMW